MKLLPLKVSQAETAVTKTANDNDKGVHTTLKSLHC